jgi:hypothetical protein
MLTPDRIIHLLLILIQGHVLVPGATAAVGLTPSASAGKGPLRGLSEPAEAGVAPPSHASAQRQAADTAH